MFSYTCRVKAWHFATSRKSIEFFTIHKYWLNQMEGSKNRFIILQWLGVHHMPLSILIKHFTPWLLVGLC